MSYEPQEQELFLKCLLEANVDGILAFDREFATPPGTARWSASQV